MLLLATVTLAVAAAAGDDTVAAGGLYVNEETGNLHIDAPSGKVTPHG
jgi:hypothetical protein